MIVPPKSQRRGTCSRPKPRTVPEMAARLAEATDANRYVPTDPLTGSELLAKVWGQGPGDCDRLGRPRSVTTPLR